MSGFEVRIGKNVKCGGPDVEAVQRLVGVRDSSMTGVESVGYGSLVYSWFSVSTQRHSSANRGYVVRNAPLNLTLFRGCLRVV